MRGCDPYITHFVQADTIVPPGVQGLDRYAYANNSPLKYVDPSGHKPCIDTDENGQCIVDPDWHKKVSPVKDIEMCWGSCYTGTMMRTLFDKYNGTEGWWNNYTTGTMTAKDFLALMLFFELGGVAGDPTAIDPLRKAAIEKFTYWCAQASGGVCSGASDQAVFNYIATRGSAWVRYDKFITGQQPISPFDGQPKPAPGSLNPLSNAGYQTIAGIADAIYAGAYGKGSLWDWGNKEMAKAGIESAPISSTDPRGVYYRNDTFYILNPDQANYWANIPGRSVTWLSVVR